MYKTTLLPLLLIAAALAPPVLPAQVPETLDYQAYLTDAFGSPVNGDVQVTFALYASEAGGTAAWSDTHIVSVDQGLMSVVLGGGATPFPEGLFAMPLWLGLAVGGDAEMTPRRQLTAAAFARAADDSQTLQGASLEDVVELAGGSIPPGARIPLAALDLDGLGVDLTGLDMALDGRSLSVVFQTPLLPVIGPLTLSYVYPLGTASPLGLPQGSLYNSIRVLLAAGTGFEVRIDGALVGPSEFSSELVESPPGSGSYLVRETATLDGQFVFGELDGPPYTGPLRVDISAPGLSDSFDAQGRGPLSFVCDGVSGPGGPCYLFDIEGIGPAEASLLLADYFDTGSTINLKLTLAGLPLPDGNACRLLSFAGLSPAQLDDSGMPVDSVQIDSATFICFGAGP